MELVVCQQQPPATADQLEHSAMEHVVVCWP